MLIKFICKPIIQAKSQNNDAFTDQTTDLWATNQQEKQPRKRDLKCYINNAIFWNKT